jgi:hypothetical protein
LRIEGSARTMLWMRVRRVPLVLVLAAGGSVLGAAAACVGENANLTPTIEAGSDVAQPPLGPPDVGAPDTGSGFCGGKAKPGGAAEFFCADFDVDPYETGWTSRVVTDAGTLGPTTMVASSPPRAVAIDIAAHNDAGENRRGGALSWATAGANVIDHVDLEVALNKRADQETLPALTGNVELLSVTTADARFTLSFTRGGNVEGSVHTGYFVAVERFNPFSFASFKLSQAIADEQWTRVKLVVNTKNGTGEVFFNGLSIRAGIGSAPHDATAATVQVGAVGRFRTIDHAFRFDDVTAAVFRE